MLTEILGRIPRIWAERVEGSASRLCFSEV